MFGVPFGTEIDMWSLGCILAEVCLTSTVLNQCMPEYLILLQCDYPDYMYSTFIHCTYSDFLIGWYVPRDAGL